MELPESLEGLKIQLMVVKLPGISSGVEVEFGLESEWRPN